MQTKRVIRNLLSQPNLRLIQPQYTIVLIINNTHTKPILIQHSMHHDLILNHFPPLILYIEDHKQYCIIISSRFVCLLPFTCVMLNAHNIYSWTHFLKLIYISHTWILRCENSVLLWPFSYIWEYVYMKRGEELVQVKP